MNTIHVYNFLISNFLFAGKIKRNIENRIVTFYQYENWWARKFHVAVDKKKKKKKNIRLNITFALNKYNIFNTEWLNESSQKVNGRLKRERLNHTFLCVPDYIINNYEWVKLDKRGLLVSFLWIYANSGTICVCKNSYTLTNDFDMNILKYPDINNTYLMYLVSFRRTPREGDTWGLVISVSCWWIPPNS